MTTVFELKQNFSQNNLLLSFALQFLWYLQSPHNRLTFPTWSIICWSTRYDMRAISHFHCPAEEPISGGILITRQQKSILPSLPLFSLASGTMVPNLNFTSPGLWACDSICLLAAVHCLWITSATDPCLIGIHNWLPSVLTLAWTASTAIHPEITLGGVSSDPKGI